MIIVQISGTNGKGSVSMYLSRILQSAGYRVGLFTSPHLIEKEERIQINGQNIPREEWERIEQTVSEKGYYKKSFSICLQWFAEKDVKVAVMETGLGGRYDPVTALHPDLNILTQIDMDHMELLGDTIEKIALEKCASICYGGTVIALPQKKAVEKIIRESAQFADAVLLQMKWKDVEMLPSSFHFAGMKNLKIKAIGANQPINAAAAVLAAIQLDKYGIRISEPQIRQGLWEATIPARLQYFEEENMLLDGGHNAGAFLELENTLKTNFKGQKIVLLAACMMEKDIKGLVKIAEEWDADVIVTSLKEDRAMPVSTMQQYFPSSTGIEDVHEAFAYAKKRQREKNALLLVAGSFYLAGEILRIRKQRDA